MAEEQKSQCPDCKQERKTFSHEWRTYSNVSTTAGQVTVTRSTFCSICGALVNTESFGVEE